MSEEQRNNEQHKRKCKVLTLIESLGATIIDIEKEYTNYKGNEFSNMNTAEDYKKVKEQFLTLP